MHALMIRFLQSGEVWRIGADRVQITKDVRVIAATHRDLADRIAQREYPITCSLNSRSCVPGASMIVAACVVPTTPSRPTTCIRKGASTDRRPAATTGGSDGGS
jgi:hypothetical protein